MSNDILAAPGDSEFVHADETMGSSGKFEAYSNAAVTMEHVRRLLRLGSVEPHASYVEESTIVSPAGEVTTNKRVPDAAAAFCSGIMSLSDYLSPHIEACKKPKQGLPDWKARVGKALDAVMVLEDKGGLLNTDVRIKTLWAYRHLFRELCGFLRSVDFFTPGGLDT